MKITSFTDLEKILLCAAKMPTITIKQLSKETGLGLSGLYKWSRGTSRLSAERADLILKWFEDNRPDILEAAVVLYNKGGIDE